jgi:hypothetical protein
VFNEFAQLYSVSGPTQLSIEINQISESIEGIPKQIESFKIQENGVANQSLTALRKFTLNQISFWVETKWSEIAETAEGQQIGEFLMTTIPQYLGNLAQSTIEAAANAVATFVCANIDGFDSIIETVNAFTISFKYSVMVYFCKKVAESPQFQLRKADFQTLAEGIKGILDELKLNGGNDVKYIKAMSYFAKWNDISGLENISELMQLAFELLSGNQANAEPCINFLITLASQSDELKQFIFENYFDMAQLFPKYQEVIAKAVNEEELQNVCDSFGKAWYYFYLCNSDQSDIIDQLSELIASVPQMWKYCIRVFYAHVKRNPDQAATLCEVALEALKNQFPNAEAVGNYNFNQYKEYEEKSSDIISLVEFGLKVQPDEVNELVNTFVSDVDLESPNELIAQVLLIKGLMERGANLTAFEDILFKEDPSILYSIPSAGKDAILADGFTYLYMAFIYYIHAIAKAKPTESQEITNFRASVLGLLLEIIGEYSENPTEIPDSVADAFHAFVFSIENTEPIDADAINYLITCYKLPFAQVAGKAASKLAEGKVECLVQVVRSYEAYLSEESYSKPFVLQQAFAFMAEFYNTDFAENTAAVNELIGTFRSSSAEFIGTDIVFAGFIETLIETHGGFIHFIEQELKQNYFSELIQLLDGDFHYGVKSITAALKNILFVFIRLESFSEYGADNAKTLIFKLFIKLFQEFDMSRLPRITPDSIIERKDIVELFKYLIECIKKMKEMSSTIEGFAEEELAAIIDWISTQLIQSFEPLNASYYLINLAIEFAVMNPAFFGHFIKNIFGFCKDPMFDPFSSNFAEIELLITEQIKNNFAFFQEACAEWGETLVQHMGEAAAGSLIERIGALTDENKDEFTINDILQMAYIH